MALLRRGPMDREALSKLVGLAFTAWGVFLIVVGILLTIADLSGLKAVAFGLVLLAIGRGVRRKFAPPEGARAVEVSGYQAPIGTGEGAPRMLRQASIIYVDANATDEEVEAAKAGWLREQWRKRPDWVAGRIISQDERARPLALATTVLWSAFAVLLVVGALVFGATVGVLAAIFVIIAGALLVYALTMRRHRRKFGRSQLVLERTPAFLGDVLSGEVESGIREDTAPLRGFHIRLRCVHRWKELRRGTGGTTGDTIRRLDVLCEAEQWTDGRVRAEDGGLSIPVRFELPADQPPTTLPAGGEGIVWQLEVTAEMDGLDYREEFEVPVLAEQATSWIAAG
ncbi:MAG TPA: hypothetical protein VIL18_11840 [Longimicrobiales bacterium]